MGQTKADYLRRRRHDWIDLVEASWKPEAGILRMRHKVRLAPSSRRCGSARPIHCQHSKPQAHVPICAAQNGRKETKADFGKGRPHLLARLFLLAPCRRKICQSPTSRATQSPLYFSWLSCPAARKGGVDFRHKHFLCAKKISTWHQMSIAWMESTPHPRAVKRSPKQST